MNIKYAKILRESNVVLKDEDCHQERAIGWNHKCSEVT